MSENTKIKLLGKEREIKKFKGADAGKLLILFDELNIKIEDFTTGISEEALAKGDIDQQAVMQEVIKFISQIGTKIIARFGVIIGKPIWKEIIQHTFGITDDEFNEMELKHNLQCLVAILKAEGVLGFLRSLGVKNIGKLKIK
jgi:tagatose-1,6-bisphosphate aldolase